MKTGKNSLNMQKILAGNKKLIFKLHPNEKFESAVKEINNYAPGSLIYTKGNTEHMVANCDILLTKYSSVVYVGLALGKEVHSEFDIEQLKKLIPIQNNGISAYNISEIGKKLLMEHAETKIYKLNKEPKLNMRLFRKYKSFRNYQKAE